MIEWVRAWSSSRRGALSDGTRVIIRGDIDGAVRVWRTADATPVIPPLHLRLPGSNGQTQLMCWPGCLLDYTVVIVLSQPGRGWG